MIRSLADATAPCTAVSRPRELPVGVSVLVSARNIGGVHEGERDPRAGVRDALYEPGVSARALSLRRPRIHDPDLPVGSGEAARLGARAAGARRAAGQI